MAGKSEKIQSSGFGESRPHIAEPGSLPDDGRDWSILTLNGKPIPEHLYGLVPYDMTDQGVEKKNEGKQEPRVQIMRDEVDNSVAHYRDDLIEGLPLEENHDPLRVLMAQHLPKGHRGLFMSEKKCDQDGMRRGVLDYQPVMVEKGGKLDRVKIGGMFLASVPEQRAQAAGRYYENRAKEAEQAAADKVREQSDQIISEQKLQRLDKRKGGGMDFGGLRSEDGEMVVGELTHEFEG